MLYGVDKAVLLNNLKYWLDHAKANGKKDFDGYFWTFNSSTAFSQLIPYMSAKKISRLLKELEDDSVIIVGNYNRANYDRTKWYTMPEYASQAISQNREMDCSELGNALSIIEQPIPDINTDNKHHSKQVAAKAAKKLTKAELLVNKIRSEPSCYQSLNCLDDELIIEWAKLRCKKGASDSNRALSRIESTLEALRYNYEISPDQAISKQCDAGWTSIEVDYFVKGNSNTGQQVAVHQPQQSLDDALQRTF